MTLHFAHIRGSHHKTKGVKPLKLRNGNDD